MSDSVQLGTISAAATLDLRPLRAGVGEAGKLLSGLSLQLEALGKPGGWQVEFNPDKLIAGAEIAGRSLSDLKDHVVGVKDNLKSLGDLRLDGKGITSGLAGAKTDLKGLGSAATGTRTRLTNLGNLRVNLADIVTGAGGATTELGSVAKAARSARTEINALSKAKEENSRLMRRGSLLSNIGNGMRAGGGVMSYGYSLPVLAAAGYSVKTAMNRGDQFADVEKVFPKESVANIAAARRELTEITHVLPLTFSQVTQLGNMGGQLGVPIQALGRFAKVAGELGMTTDLSAEKATEGLAKIAAAMGMDVSTGPGAAKTFHDLGEQLAQMGIEGAATGSEIVRTAERIASAGKNAGMSAGDILALSNGLASLGQRAEAGGSAALRTITKMTVAVATGNKQLSQYANIAGMSADQFKSYFQSDALGALLRYTDGLNKLQQSGKSSIAVLSEMGLKNSSELIALQNLSHAGSMLLKFREDNKKAVSEGNILETAAAKKADDTASKFRILQNRVEEVAGKLGDNLIPVLLKLEPNAEKLLGVVSHLIDDFNRLPEPIKEGALELLAVSVAAGPVVTAVGGVVSVAGALLRGFAAFKALRMASEIDAVATSTGTLATEAVAAETAVDGLGLSLVGARSQLKGVLGLLTTPLKGAGTLGGLLLGTAAGTATVAVGLPLALGAVLHKALDPEDAATQSKRLNGDFHITSTASGSSAVVDTMIGKMQKGIVEAGLQCGSAITKALKENGINATATSLRDRARKNPAFREQPIGVDNRGAPRYHEGTIFFFPAGGGSKEQHFAMAHTSPEGQQMVAEYTKAGTGKYHYRDDRGLAAVAAEHGANYEAFNAVSAPTAKASAGKASPSTSRAGFDASLFGDSKSTEEVAALKNRLYEATHSDYENAKHEAKVTYDKDKKTDPVAAKALYNATLKRLDAEEEAEQKKHHAAVEKAQQAHLARMAAMQDRQGKKVASDKARTSETRAEVGDHLAALADPDVAGFAKERAAAEKTYRDRIKSYGGDPSLSNAQLQKMPYSPQTLNDFQGAQNELTGSLADIKNRQGQKGAEAAQKVKDQAAQDADDVAGFQKQAAAEQADLNREVWQHAGGDMKKYFDSLRAEADAALLEVQAKYGPTSKNPNAAAIAAAQGVHDSKYAVYAQQEVDDAKSTQEKIDDAQAESVRFEYAQHLISLRQYQQYLRQKLALTQMYDTPQDKANGVLSGNWMKLKSELDSTNGDGGKDNGRSAFSWIGDEMGRSLQSGTEKFHSFHSFFKQQVKEMQSIWKQALLQMAEQWALLQLTGASGGGLGGIFKKQVASFGGQSPFGALSGLLGGGKAKTSPLATGLSALSLAKPAAGGGSLLSSPLAGMIGGQANYNLALPAGLGSDPGMTPGGMGGGSSPLGGLSGLTGLLGKGGMLGGLLGKSGIGGLFAHGGLFTSGGALGGFGAALPWVGGGLMLNSLLGNPLGKAFKGLGKIFHFAQGGFVPGHGFHDSVPAMLTPGERVLTKAQQQGMGGGTVIHITHNGDINNQQDADNFHQMTAWGVSQQLPTAVPGN